MNKKIIFASGVSLNVCEAFGIHTKKGTEPRINTILDVVTDGKTNIPGLISLTSQIYYRFLI